MKNKDASTYKTTYGMEVSFFQDSEEATQYDMQDINHLTGYALGLKDLKGKSYDAADSVMALTIAMNTWDGPIMI